uniref:hypothetical protein n=1 Tax=Nosocomiicoccus ampullae TaxID=489910 RepID=UPI000A01AFD8|nr:hypothetical protein [Nosocomiicoccus ampullae]
MISVTENPSGKTYEALLDFLFETCDTFQLVVRTDILKYEHAFQDLNEWFGDSFIEVLEQHEWPSTNLFDDTAKVYYFKTTSEAKDKLLERSNSLYDWSLPDSPEDLCFFKDDEAYLSVSSELEEIYLYPTSDEEVAKIKNIGGLKTVEISF